MFKIYSAGNIHDAYLIQGLLNKAGIECRILNEYAQGGVGEIPFTQAYPEIWLTDESNVEKAKIIISQYETHQQSVGEEVCPHCGETNPDTFETCWHCSKPIKD